MRWWWGDIRKVITVYSSTNPQSITMYVLLPNEKKDSASTLGRYTFYPWWVTSLYWTVWCAYMQCKDWRCQDSIAWVVSFVLPVQMQCLDQNSNRCVNGVHLHKCGSITSKKFMCEFLVLTMRWLGWDIRRLLGQCGILYGKCACVCARKMGLFPLTVGMQYILYVRS